MDAGDGNVVLRSNGGVDLHLSDLPYDLKGAPRTLGAGVDIGPYEASWDVDLDGDGQPGLLEAFLGTSETAGNGSWVDDDDFRSAAGPVSFRFRRTAALPPGLTGTIRWSTELDPHSWTEVLPGQMTTDPVPDRPDQVEVTVEVPFATKPSRFFATLEVSMDAEGE